MAQVQDDPWTVVSVGDQPAKKKPAVKRLAAKHKADDPWAVDSIGETDSVPSLSGGVGATFVTEQNQKEGRYLMQTDNGQREDVPFSAINDATAQGYKLLWTEQNRYRNDLDYFKKTQKSNQPPTGYRANVKAEAEAVPQGIGSLFAPTASTGGKILEAATGPAGVGALAGIRLLQSEVQSRSGLADQAVKYGVQAGKEHDTVAGLRSAVSLLTALVPVPGIAAIAQKINDTVDRGDIAGGWGILTVDVPLLLAGLKASGKITEPVKNLATKTIGKMVQKYRPVEVDVAGTKIPMLQSEAHPDSRVGDYVKETKERAIGAPLFRKFGGYQQEQAKGGIRGIIKQSSRADITPNMEVEEAATAGARALRAEAKPMYAPLDETVIGIPKDWNNVSSMLDKAIKRARDRGAQIPDSESSSVKVIVDSSGKEIDPADYPAREFEKDEVAKKLASGEWHEKELSLAKTPITDFQNVRSQLMDMQRAAYRAGKTNEARLIGDDIRQMNQEADDALKGTKILKDWKQADKLWARSVTFDSLSDELYAATKGTPPEATANPVYDPVPTRIEGANLVNRLNDLVRDGVIQRGFTPDEVKNLRQCAEILDRGQQVRIGGGAGETVSKTRGVTHFLAGNPLTVTGGLLGGIIGLLTHFPFGVEAGVAGGGYAGFMLDIAKRKALVKVMTTPEGVRAIRDLSYARTPTQTTIAMRRLVVAMRKAVPAVTAARGAAPEPQPTHIFNDQTGYIEPVQ